MGEFVNKMLAAGSSVNKMAEAMQAAPRRDPRENIDRPLAESEQPQAGPAGPAAEPTPKEQEAMQMEQRKQGMPQGQAPTPHDGPMLSPGSGNTEMGDPSTGGAMQRPTPEEEKQARMLVANATDFIFGEGLQKVTKFLKEGNSIPEAIGETTAMLVGSEVNNADAAGVQVSPNIMVSVGAEIINQIYELAEALGLWSAEDEAQVNEDMSLSLNYAANMYVEQQVKTGHKERLEGLPETMGAIQAGEYDSRPGSALPNDIAPGGAA